MPLNGRIIGRSGLVDLEYPYHLPEAF